MTKTNLYPLAVIVALIAMVLVMFGYNHAFGSASTTATPRCTVSTSTSALIGTQVSREILPASTRRAWASIQVPAQATSSIYLAFNAGTAASIGKGTGINTSASSSDRIVFGLDTDFPYVDAVQGITSVGSTTVLITECDY